MKNFHVLLIFFKYFYKQKLASDTYLSLFLRKIIQPNVLKHMCHGYKNIPTYIYIDVR